jgi:hypothetical protein
VASGTTDLDPFRPQLVTVDTPTRADKERLQGLGLDLTEHAGHDYVEVVLHDAADVTQLLDADFTYDVRIADLIRREAENNAANATYAAEVSTSPLPSGRTTYRTLADYEADLSALASTYPGHVREFTLPHTTLDGKQVHGVEIGSDVEQTTSERPTFVLMGLHHAREWPSGELAMEFATDLAQGYGTDARITGLLDKGRVVVVPVVNPDGFDLSRTDGGLIDLRDLNEVDPTGGTVSIAGTPGHAYKRKNCRIVDGEDTPDGTCRATLTSNIGAGPGVDLNRNYGGFWGGPGAAGPTPNPETLELGTLDPTYRGAAPFSEPETRNVHDLIAGRHATMVISNHTFSNLVLRPNGVNPQTIGHDGKPVGDSPEEPALKALGAKMTAANGYANIHGWELYDTTGTTEDWSYNATGGFGYTFEIGPNEFHPPFPQVVDEYVGAGEYAGKGNREAYLVALEHAVDPTSHSILNGNAPAGAKLTLSKTFDSPTWSGSYRDGVSSDLVVDDDGKFSWHVNPSTRPVVMARPYQELAPTPVESSTIDGGAIAPLSSADHEVAITRDDIDLWRVKLDWPTPDDLDLEIYRRDGAELTLVGSSGNAPGSKEEASVTTPAAGTYVVRVINYASVTPSYTVTQEQFNAVTKYTEGTTESYTLTCTVNGQLRQSTQVTIARGEAQSVPRSLCRRSA